MGDAARAVDAAQNRLGEVPAAIARLPGLTTLNLACNSLTRIHPAIAGLDKLRVLVLDRNERLGVLPDEVGSLRSLQTLQVADW